MNSNYMQAAGPEWAYCASLAAKSNKLVDLDNLVLTVEHESGSGRAVNEPIQLLDQGHGAAGNTQGPVLRYTFDKFRQRYLGQDSDNLHIIFQAYEGAPRIEIPDDQSFRMLLVAIQSMGLPMPEALDMEAKYYPPALRFTFGPQGLGAPVPQIPERPNAPVPQTPERPNAPVPPMPERPNKRKLTEGGTIVGVRNDGKRLFGMGRNSPGNNDEVDNSGADKGIVDGTLAETPFMLDVDEADEELPLMARMQQVYDFRLNNERPDVHNRDWHDLYAKIAGIPQRHTNSSNRQHHYRPPYSKITMPPYQTYPVGWLFGDRERILHYLADWPGLGKTFSAIEAMVRIMIILSLGVDVKNELNNLDNSENPPRHVHDRSHPTHGRNTECQADTVGEYGVVCPCKPGSPTADLASGDTFGKGYMLVLTPHSLTSQWRDKIQDFLKKGFVLPHNKQPIEVVDTSNEGGINNAVRNFIYGTRPHNGLGSICIAGVTPGLNACVRELRDMGKPAPTQQPCIIAWDEVHNYKNPDTLGPRLIDALVDAAPQRLHVLAISGSPIDKYPFDFKAVELIATAYSFQHFYGKEKDKGYKDQLRLTWKAFEDAGKAISTSVLVRNCQSGRDLSEEDTTKVVDLIRTYDQCGRQYASALPMLYRRSLDDYLGSPIPRVSPKAARAEVIRCDWVMNDAQRQIGTMFKKMLDTRFNSKKKSYGKTAEKAGVPKPTMESFLLTLEATNSVSSDRMMYHPSRIDMSLAAFAPGLANRILGRTQRTQFRSEEANSIFHRSTIATQRATVQNSEYWDVAEDLFTKVDPGTGGTVLSPKIREICRIIDAMLTNKDPHSDRLDHYPQLPILRKKAVICVPYPWHGYILIAYLFKRYPNHNFTYVGSNFSRQQRWDLMEPFRRQTAEHDPKEDDPNDPIVLISTYNLMAEGLNLTRCNYCIATSPLSSTSFDTQLFGRINRFGQYCNTHTYVLVDDGDPTDVITYHRMLGRTADVIPPNERGSGLAFLLEDQEARNEADFQPEMDSGGEHSDQDSVYATPISGSPEAGPA